MTRKVCTDSPSVIEASGALQIAADSDLCKTKLRDSFILTHKRLPPSAKPSRQREPFTGVAVHSSVLIPFWQLQAVYRCVQAISGTSAKSLLGPG